MFGGYATFCGRRLCGASVQPQSIWHRREWSYHRPFGDLRCLVAVELALKDELRLQQLGWCKGHEVGKLVSKLVCAVLPDMEAPVEASCLPAPWRALVEAAEKFEEQIRRSMWCTGLNGEPVLAKVYPDLRYVRLASDFTEKAISDGDVDELRDGVQDLFRELNSCLRRLNRNGVVP